MVYSNVIKNIITYSFIQQISIEHLLWGQALYRLGIWQWMTVTNSSPESIHDSGGTDNKQNKNYVYNQYKKKSLIGKGNRKWRGAEILDRQLRVSLERQQVRRMRREGAMERSGMRRFQAEETALRRSEINQDVLTQKGRTVKKASCRTEYIVWFHSCFTEKG